MIDALMVGSTNPKQSSELKPMHYHIPVMKTGHVSYCNYMF